MILDACGVSVEDVETAGPDRLRALATLYPVLGAHHQLLWMNARVSASHLMLTKKFLFKPTRAAMKRACRTPIWCRTAPAPPG